MSLTTVNRELAAPRAAFRLDLDDEVITAIAMPRIKLLPEANVRKGFAEANAVSTNTLRRTRLGAPAGPFGAVRHHGLA